MSDWPKDGVRTYAMQLDGGGVVTDDHNKVFIGSQSGIGHAVIIRTAEQDAARSAVVEAARECVKPTNPGTWDALRNALAALTDTETTGHATDRPEGET